MYFLSCRSKYPKVKHRTEDPHSFWDECADFMSRKQVIHVLSEMSGEYSYCEHARAANVPPLDVFGVH